MWVLPTREVAAIGQITALHQIAVCQQNGKRRFVGTQGDLVSRHHIGAVQEVGDPAEALCLALGEKRLTAHVQAHELRVLLGVAHCQQLEIKGFKALRKAFEYQFAVVDFEATALSVDHHAGQRQVLSLEAQRLLGNIGVAAQTHFVQYACFGGVEVKTQCDRFDPKRGRGVVFALNQRGGVCGVSHQCLHKCLVQ